MYSATADISDNMNTNELREVDKSKMLKALTSGSIIRMFHMFGRCNKKTDKHYIENVVNNNVSNADEEIYYSPILVVFDCEHHRLYDSTRQEWVWQFLVYDGKHLMCALCVGSDVVDLFETGKMKVGTIFKAEVYTITSIRRIPHTKDNKDTYKVCCLTDVTPIATTPRSSLIDISFDMVDDIDMCEQMIQER